MDNLFKQLLDLESMTSNIESLTIETKEIPFEETDMGKYYAKTQDYRDESLKALNEIKENTAALPEIVDLIMQSNNNQEEIITIISKIFSIAKAKNEEEAKGALEKVRDEITATVESAEATKKLFKWASFIFNLVITIINNRQNLT